MITKTFLDIAECFGKILPIIFRENGWHCHYCVSFQVKTILGAMQFSVHYANKRYVCSLSLCLPMFPEVFQSALLPPTTECSAPPPPTLHVPVTCHSNDSPDTSVLSAQ